MARGILTAEELNDLLGEAADALDEDTVPDRLGGPQDAGPARRFERHPCHLAAQLVFGSQRYRVRVQDLSVGGASVETPDSVPVETAGVLTVKLPGFDDPLEAPVHVCWNEITPGHWSRLGIEFDALKPAEFVALMDFLSRD